jgi:Zn-dependent protease/predicted transcriptional regulator
MNGLLIGRVRGIEIRVNWSVAIIGWLVAWSLATRVLPEMVEGRTDTAYWAAGIVATVGFLAALVAHELGHSLVALHHGVDVRSITLWMLGGIARLDRTSDTPTAAFRIAAAGPAVSVACGVIGLAAATLGEGLVAAVLLWFGSINLLLAVFNLLPAFPLDGGRIYQAWLWRRGLSEEQATAKAARLGSGIGRAMVWLGVLEIFLIGVLSGLWMMAIGWFIREASYAEARSSREASALGRFTCADVMTSRPDSVPTTRSIERFVDDVLSTGRHAAYTAFDSDQRVVGLMEVKSVRLTPRDAWPTTEVSAAMTPLAEVPVASADATLDVLVRRMDEHAGTRALIMDGDRLVGIVSPSDIVRLTIAVELAAGADPGPGGHATESI